MSVVASIRKVAALQEGRRAFTELTSPEGACALDVVLMKKAGAAGAADRTLLAIAGAIRPSGPLAMYEELGGGWT